MHVFFCQSHVAGRFDELRELSVGHFGNVHPEAGDRDLVGRLLHSVPEVTADTDMDAIGLLMGGLSSKGAVSNRHA